MNDKELKAFKDKIKRRQKVMKRLKETAPGETVCLSFDEVASMLEYIESLWKVNMNH